MAKTKEKTVESTNGKYVGGETPSPTALAMQPDTVFYVPATAISIEDGFNARDFSAQENKDHIARLAKLIAANGVENPLRVRIADGRIIVIDGESRLRAALTLEDFASGSREIPILLDTDNDPVHRVQSLIVKNTGKPLAMIEQLIVVSRLEAMGQTVKDIQEALGFTRTAFSNLRLLGKAPETVLEAVANNQISASVVVELQRAYGDTPEVVAKAVEKAVKAAEREALADPKRAGKAKKAKPDGVQYTRGLYDGLISTIRDVYWSLEPKTHRKERGWLKNALQNINAPLKIDEPDADDDEE